MKIILLPEELAGQSRNLVLGLRAIGLDAVNLSGHHPLGYEADIYFKKSKFKIVRYIDKVIKYLNTNFSYDVYHYHYAKSLLPMHLDVVVNKFFRKRVLVEFYGSDIRMPELESLRNKYYINSYHENSKINQKKMRIWAYLTNGEAIVSDSYMKFFLEPYFKKIHIVGLRLDVKSIKPNYVKNRTIKIVHAPSQKAFKGTKYLECAISNMQRSGLKFEYIRIEN
uniref:hypothetical protein n=1 Tax=Flavobacterium sp. TaxID=239 RepID=UPI004047B72F